MGRKPGRSAGDGTGTVLLGDRGENGSTGSGEATMGIADDEGEAMEAVLGGK